MKLSECKLEKFEVVYCFRAWMRMAMRMAMRMRMRRDEERGRDRITRREEDGL